MKCLCCGKLITDHASEAEKTWQWHRKCVKKFFQTKEMPVLDITKEQLEKLANETVNEGLTVPGVQKKLSLHLSSDLNNCASHSRYFSDELDAHFYKKIKNICLLKETHMV